MPNTLNTPILDPILAFDPHYSHTFGFSYSGPQVIRTRAVIINNADYSTQYDKTADGLRLSHLLPADILKPGGDYLIQIQVFDVDNNSSNLSEPVKFRCFTTPQFGFTDLSDGITVSTANLKSSLSYSQPEGETLQEFKFYLYEYDKTLLSSSDSFYSSPQMQHTFYSLKNDSVYYIRAVGKTVNGMSLDTGYLQIKISYYSIPANMIFKVENYPQKGYITFSTGIKSIGYTLDNDHYTIDNSELTLKDNMLHYNDGFCIADDFSIVCKARQLPIKPFFILKSSDISYQITLEIVEIDQQYYCKLNVPYALGSYVIYRELPKPLLVDPEENFILDSNGNKIRIIDTIYHSEDLMIFELRRKNGIYDLSVYYEEELL